ncbi:MAG: CubicO group peptidase (beta-lactamase class C family) [Crocinitomicaceae bacterium]|jgi:CubicO group peptidase (beta-lactamase class C family)
MKRILKKIGKYLLIIFIGLFITVNAFILLSGRLYIYKGIANTYLVGKMGPTIYDLDVFPYSTLKATGTSELSKHEDYNKSKIPTDMRTYIEDLETKAYLVFRGDSLLYEEYWDDHTQGTVSNSFSMAKTVVAMLIGIAIEDGKIGSLDESASEYLPEFKGGELEKITIRHLLTMSSGLDWTESGKNPLSDNAESYYGWELRELVTGQKLITPPGKIFKYQSGNSQLLAFIVEKATGQDLTAYAQEKIWDKIGATDDAHWSLDKEDGDEKAFCCMYATSRDYARLGLLLHNKGKVGDEQVVPEWFYNEMIRPAKLKTEYGIENLQYGLHIWTYFGGENPAYYYRGVKGQYVISIPAEDLLIVRIGSERKPKYEIPEEHKKDKNYVEKHKHEVGHALGFFKYIELGKLINSQTKK